MENKGLAEGTDVSRPAEKEATLMQSAKDRFRQFKDAPAAEHWVCLKNKVRAAGEYAGLVTHQGVSMFGEPKIGYMFQRGPDPEGHPNKTSAAES